LRKSGGGYAGDAQSDAVGDGNADHGPGGWAGRGQVPESQVKANASYVEGVRAFAKGQTIKGNDSSEAQTLFREALDKVSQARQGLLAEIYQYRLMEALVLSEMKNHGEAWRVLDELSEQTANSAIRERARVERDKLLSQLEPINRATLDFDCGGIDAGIKLEQLAPEGGTTSTGSEAVAHATKGLDTNWLPCSGRSKQRLLPPGKYVIRMRRLVKSVQEKPFETMRIITLSPGDQRTMLVHFEVAPSPTPIDRQCGGCTGPPCTTVSSN
jgi:hypothetical protein